MDPKLISDPFIFEFNDKKFTVSKFRASLYSKKFREIVCESDIKSYVFSSSVSQEIFENFILAIQGEQYTITGDTIYSLYRLANEWKVDTLRSEIEEFIDEKPEIDTICNIIGKSIAPGYTGLESIIASHISLAIKYKSFKSLKLNFVRAVIMSPSLNVTNQEEYFNYFLDMLNEHGPAATFIIKGVDFSQIKPLSIIRFLNNPTVNKAEAAPYVVDIIKSCIEESRRIENQITEDHEILFQIQSPLPKIEKIISITEEISAKVEDTSKRIDDFSSKGIEDISTLLDRMTVLEGKMRVESKKNSADVVQLRSDEKSLQTTFEGLRLRQRDLRRRPLDIEEPETEAPLGQRPLTPVPLVAEAPLKGILDMLSAAANGAINDIVKITASGTTHGSPSVVAERGTTDYWWSANKPNQWIMFDFMMRLVKVTDYTIKTFKYSEGSAHLRAWVLEGSNDCLNWDILDERRTDALNSANAVVSFKCAVDAGQYRYIRLKQTDTTHRGDDLLALNNVEFFGIVVDV